MEIVRTCAEKTISSSAAMTCDKTALSFISWRAVLRIVDPTNAPGRSDRQ
jgi:hypothetical protein